MSNRQALAIDFGGTKTMLGIVSESGDRVGVRTFATGTPDSPETFFAECARLLRQCAEEAGIALAELAGIGVTVPGLADAGRGVLRYAPHLGWRDVPVTELLRGSFPQLPIAVANDVNACALAERQFGAAKDARSFLWVTVSTGIGGALVLDGSLYEGETGIAGEIGHMCVEWVRGLKCSCGRLGCLEAHASGTAIAKEAEKLIARDGEGTAMAAYFRERGLPVTAKHVADAAREGVEEAVGLLEQAGGYLGRAFAASAALLNPGLIVVGGGVSLSWDLLARPVGTTYRNTVFGDDNAAVPIRRTELGYEAGLLGAAALVFSQ